MRRTTQYSEPVHTYQRPLFDAIAALDDAAVAEAIALLEPHVTEARLARLRGVFASRLEAVTVVLDSPHDPHNGAAVLRTCDAFGLQSLHVIVRHEGFLAHRAVARGSQQWVDVVPHDGGTRAVETLSGLGYELVGTHPEGQLTPEDLASIPRLALVFGNERDGIGPDVAPACRRSVRVPMRGFAESLNVSVTAALLLYAATRRREGDLPEHQRARLLLRGLALTLPHAAEMLEAKGFAIPAPSELLVGPHPPEPAFGRYARKHHALAPAPRRPHDEPSGTP
jgi:tRNA (guanosine-2'-O-)-methyltransferase